MIKLVLKGGSNGKNTAAYSSKLVPNTTDTFIVDVPALEKYLQPKSQFVLDVKSKFWKEKVCFVEVHIQLNPKDKFIKFEVVELDLSQFMNQHFKKNTEGPINAKDDFYSYSNEENILFQDKDPKI